MSLAFLTAGAATRHTSARDGRWQVCAVADVYRISKYETTNAQYTEFLNAVAATDTEGLYNFTMAYSGITRSGDPGSFTYTTIAGREDIPVVKVSFYDALRFSNWLHNGQPTGAQSNATTENGAYTLLGRTPADAMLVNPIISLVRSNTRP